jgi:hypothetical protein
MNIQVLLHRGSSLQTKAKPEIATKNIFQNLSPDLMTSHNFHIANTELKNPTKDGKKPPS